MLRLGLTRAAALVGGSVAALFVIGAAESTRERQGFSESYGVTRHVSYSKKDSEEQPGDCLCKKCQSGDSCDNHGLLSKMSQPPSSQQPGETNAGRSPSASSNDWYRLNNLHMKRVSDERKSDMKKPQEKVYDQFHGMMDIVHRTAIDSRDLIVYPDSMKNEAGAIVIKDKKEEEKEVEPVDNSDDKEEKEGKNVNEESSEDKGNDKEEDNQNDNDAQNSQENVDVKDISAASAGGNTDGKMEKDSIVDEKSLEDGKCPCEEETAELSKEVKGVSTCPCLRGRDKGHIK